MLVFAIDKALEYWQHRADILEGAGITALILQKFCGSTSRIAAFSKIGRLISSPQTAPLPTQTDFNKVSVSRQVSRVGSGYGSHEC